MCFHVFVTCVYVCVCACATCVAFRCPAGESCNPVTGETAACPAGTWSALGDGDCGVCDSAEDLTVHTCTAFSDGSPSDCTCRVRGYVGEGPVGCNAMTGDFLSANLPDCTCADGYLPNDAGACIAVVTARVQGSATSAKLCADTTTGDLATDGFAASFADAESLTARASCEDIPAAERRLRVSEGHRNLQTALSVVSVTIEAG